LLLLALRLTNLRNLEPLVLEPAARFNVFSGNNGQGKTNLLEGIYLAGTLRSFRAQRLAELIAFGADEAHVAARVERGGLERLCEVTLRPRSRVVRLDKKAVRPIARYFGEFNVVLFAPEDLQVPRSSPRERRRFLDRALFHRTPGYLDVARAYDKVVKSRNALLRAAEGRPGRSQLDMLAVYDEQLATHGARVIAARARFLDEIRPRFRTAFDAITQAGLEVDLRYQPPGDLVVDPDDDAGAAAQLRDLVSAARRADLARQVTTVGPHRDDLEFQLSGRSAASYASQGQLRATVLAWKTAEMDLLEQSYGEPPILLLDDVSSELDPSRNEYLFEFLRQRKGQCFITTTHRKHVLLTADRADYEVESGRVSVCNS
jgi:DNA replication and repair protein RecF